MVFRMQQIHGDNVVVVDRNYKINPVLNCDALVTSDRSLTLEVHTADCLPISVIDESKHVTGLIHAGWRGLSKEIIKNTLNEMKQKFDVNLNDVKVIIGPHICEKCYEVKDDLLKIFNENITSKNNKLYLSLSNLAVKQLIELGVNEININIDKRCTFEDSNLYSYRRHKTDKRNITLLEN